MCVNFLVRFIIGQFFKTMFWCALAHLIRTPTTLLRATKSRPARGMLCLPRLLTRTATMPVCCEGLSWPAQPHAVRGVPLLRGLRHRDDAVGGCLAAGDARRACRARDGRLGHVRSTPPACSPLLAAHGACARCASSPTRCDAERAGMLPGRMPAWLWRQKAWDASAAAQLPAALDGPKGVDAA